MRDNVIFIIFCLGCLLVGQVATHTFLTVDKVIWPVIVLRTSFIMDLVYFIMFLLCIFKVTAKHTIKDAFKLLVLVVMVTAAHFVPSEWLLHHYGHRIVVIMSIVWLFIQCLHVMENFTIFHNFVLFNTLNVRPWQAEQRPQALKWLYVHLSCSGLMIGIACFLCHNLQAILASSRKYDMDCINYNYVDAMYNSVVVVSIVLV